MNTAVHPHSSAPLVRSFRQILLWPVQLMPLREGSQIQRHWEHLTGPSSPWMAVEDEFTQDPADFKERHYTEFVAFVPYVQRFLYGERGRNGDGFAASPVRVFRRGDVATARVTGRDGGEQDFAIVHIDLYFFYDIDVAILAVEIHATDMPLDRAQDMLYRLGRAYPSFWNDDGSAGQCPRRVEWIGHDGVVLAASDYDDREHYLPFVCRNRAPCIAAHWAYLLQPMVLHHSEAAGALRYRQLEYQRMPLMAYLSLDAPETLSRGDWVRLALATGPGNGDGSLPLSPAYLADFEQRICYDRFWPLEGSEESCRILCCGHAFIMVGRAGDAFFSDQETGMQSQFRHQYFLLGLIAHFHRAALLMLSDRLGDAIARLDIGDIDSVRTFKRVIRQLVEIFLRFTHRYWFHVVSNQGPARELFRLWSGHLGTDALFDEVRERVQAMGSYLDADGFRRQANSVLRLTVVTIFGMIGTLVTGFLGINLIAAAEEPLWLRTLYFIAAVVPVTGLVLYSVIRSKRLADFLEALSDERLSARAKLGALVRVWWRTF